MWIWTLYILIVLYNEFCYWSFRWVRTMPIGIIWLLRLTLHFPLTSLILSFTNNQQNFRYAQLQLLILLKATSYVRPENNSYLSGILAKSWQISAKMRCQYASFWIIKTFAEIYRFKFNMSVSKYYFQMLRINVDIIYIYNCRNRRYRMILQESRVYNLNTFCQLKYFVGARLPGYTTISTSVVCTFNKKEWQPKSVSREMIRPEEHPSFML